MGLGVQGLGCRAYRVGCMWVLAEQHFTFFCIPGPKLG